MPEFSLEYIKFFSISPFTFFQMQFKILFYSIELREPPFRETPEILNAVNVNARALWKLILTMTDSEMLIKSHIYQSVIAPPFVRINDRRRINFPFDYPLQNRFLAVWHDFRIHMAIAFEYAKYRLLERASAAFEFSMKTSNTFCSKITLIYLSFSKNLSEFPHLTHINSLTKYVIPIVNRITIYVQQNSCFWGWNINTEMLHNFFQSKSWNLRIIIHLSRLSNKIS